MATTLTPAQQLAQATQKTPAASVATQPSTFGGSNNAPAGTAGIRSDLTSMGFPNQDIGWNGTDVTLSGPGLQTQDIAPDANFGGTTYANPADISGAATATGWQPQQEQQINDLVSSLVQKINGQDQQVQGALNNYQNAASTPFSFNTNSPLYQAAQTSAQQLAQQASDTTGADIASHGGTMSSAMVQGMQNTENQDYTQALASELPGLESNQYNEYQGNISNLANVLNTQQGLSQQDVSNLSSAVGTESSLQNTTAQQQLAQATLAMNENRYGAEATNYMTTAAVNSVKATGEVTTQQESDILGVPIGTPSAQALQAAATLQLKQQQLAVSQENAGTSAFNASTNAGRLALSQSENSTKDTDADATSSFVGYLVSQPSAAAAESFIAQNASAPDAQSIDWTTVYDALAKQWPDTYGAAGTGGTQ